ncbi:cubilin homolog [Mytilus californianus]|uniref:cubilin homolog n=1 Tax=Mytilus californianus TaxID=6549 RepID=UPI00224625DB|nr:cubilin homolog [Mytilus californianus]
MNVGSTDPEIDSALTTAKVSGPIITNQIITTVKSDVSNDAVSGPSITNQITTIKADVSTAAAVSCLFQSCQNDGDCVNDKCQCKPNYAGDHCQKAYSLSGCYWILYTVETNLTLVTPLACVEACIAIAFDYAGLVGGYMCKCGTTISGGIQASTCNVDCNGDSAYKCGGAMEMSIYHIV